MFVNPEKSLNKLAVILNKVHIMLENPGKSLKKFAGILFWLGIIGSVVLAIEFGKDEVFLVGAFFWFFSILIGGILLSLLEYLFLAAIGDIADNLNENKKTMSMLLDNQSVSIDQIIETQKAIAKMESKMPRDVVPAERKTPTEASSEKKSGVASIS